MILMKKLFIPIMILISTHSFANALPRPVTEMETRHKSYIQTNSGSKDFKWKSHTSCSSKAFGSDVVYPRLEAAPYYICPDKTISHIQPESTGINGWEGYCGQTAVSNVTSMLCNRHMSPKGNDYYGTDATPGQHSSTMRKSLRKIFTEFPSANTCPKAITWNTRTTWTRSGFLRSVKGDLFGSTKKVRRYRSERTYVSVTPTPVLLNSGGLNYHWVTVVDIIDNRNDDYGCDVIVNTWGDQKTLTCEHFVEYGDHSGLGEHVSLGFD